MSLISDALKRAQAQQAPPEPTPPPEAEPPPSEPPPEPPPKSRFGGGLKTPLLLLLALSCFAGGGWYIWKFVKGGGPAPETMVASAGKQSAEAKAAAKPGPTGAGKPGTNAATSTNVTAGTKRPSSAKGSNTVAKATPGTTTPTAPAPPAETPKPLEPTPAPSQPTPPEATTAAATPNPAAPPTATPAASGWPELKLQAIFFRSSNPSVRINRTTLHEGQEVAGVRIVKIQRDNVEVSFSGETKVLSLGQ